MESPVGPPHVLRRNSISLPPNVSELRMVLLGNDSSEISRVGNFILGRKAFDPEAPPPSVEQHSERAGGTVMGRNITLINTPHLFHPHLSSEELNQRVRESVSLCSPGPHVLVLVLQPDDFTEADKDRLYHILFSLSEEPHKHILVVTTHELLSGSSVDSGEDKVSQKIITRFTNRHLEFSSKRSRSDLVKMLEKMIEENEGSYIQWEEYEDAPLAKEPQQYEKTTQRESEPTVREESTKKTRSERLNLVLCGSDGAAKSSISDLILGQKEFSPESSSVCVRREGEVCGRLITLVDLPALYNTQLSEEEVMQETLHCVSLCDPGVHAFLLILPEGRLTDEDKGEVEKIQSIFGSRFNHYTIALINTEIQKGAVDATIKFITETYKVKVCLLDTTLKSVLLQKVQQMMEQNSERCYTANMYLQAQLETQLRYKSEIEELKTTISNFKEDNRIQTQDTGDLRIVLLGKTGVGKSATGNTILGGKKFRELLSFQSVTSVCQKESAEVRQRRVTVIDTPGLFDTSINNEEIKKEIAKCITMAAPGPHVFLLVLTVGQRFTQEEKEAVKMIQDLFGEESRRYTMVLFTRGDDLEERGIEQFIKDSDRSLQNIISQCGHRYHVFNNKKREEHTQVSALLEKIEHMVEVNGGSCYTNEMFLEVEKALQEEQERILKEREEEIEREKEELRAKHEAELEKMKKTMEEEQQKQDEERKEREREFREREEQIKRESAERERIERENYNRRREEDEKIMKEWTAEINREREENRKQWEKQREEDQRRRDQEEEERRKKEEEWKKNQREEKEKFEREREEMIQKERAHQQKLQQEYEQKKQEEKKWRRDLEERIKQTEESKRKELLELQVSQQREWERMKEEEERRRRDLEERIKYVEESKKKELLELQITQQTEWERMKEEEERRRRDLEERIKQTEESKRKELLELQVSQQRERERMKEEEEKMREEQEKQWRERIELKEREWELQQNHKQQQFEQERRTEMERRAIEEEKRKQRAEEEKTRIENEVNKKIQQMETRMDLQRETEMKQREENYKKELEETLKTQREIFLKEEEERGRTRKEEGARNLADMRKMHEEEKEKLRKQAEEAARREAEEEFCARLDVKIREAKSEGHKEGYSEGEKEGHQKGFREGEQKGHKRGVEEVEAQRSRPGKSIDAAVNMLWNLFEEKKTLDIRDKDKDTQKIIK